MHSDGLLFNLLVVWLFYLSLLPSNFRNASDLSRLVCESGYTCGEATTEQLYRLKEEDRLGSLIFVVLFYGTNVVLWLEAYSRWHGCTSLSVSVSVSLCLCLSVSLSVILPYFHYSSLHATFVAHY